jgi:hypothetical protein
MDKTVYCPLSREALVENARLRAMVGEEDPTDETMLLEEVAQLHAERDWALQALADARGVPLSDARVLMRRAFGNVLADETPLSTDA